MVKKRRFLDPKFLFFTYRAAIKGDIKAAQFLLNLAIGFLDRNEPLPPGLKRYFISIVRDPNRYHEIMTHKSKSKSRRGRPALNSRSTRVDSGFRSRFTPHRYSLAEEYTMAMMYLVSRGHPINIATIGPMESATTILSELTGRSERALQSDYYAHKDALLQDRDVLTRGELELKALRNISELKKGVQNDPDPTPSQ